jgi:hypothetical protein
MRPHPQLLRAAAPLPGGGGPCPGGVLSPVRFFPSSRTGTGTGMRHK